MKIEGPGFTAADLDHHRNGLSDLPQLAAKASGRAVPKADR